MNGHSAGGFMVTIKEALLARSWDYITLQQVSENSCCEESLQPYLGELAAYVRKYCPKAKLLIHQTWGYETGSPRLYNLGRGYETYEDMFAETKRCYAKAATDIQADDIIPSGQAFRSTMFLFSCLMKALQNRNISWHSMLQTMHLKTEFSCFFSFDIARGSVRCAF